jgi:hypothetical protein
MRGASPYKFSSLVPTTWARAEIWWGVAPLIETSKPQVDSLVQMEMFAMFDLLKVILVQVGSRHFGSRSHGEFVGRS